MLQTLSCFFSIKKLLLVLALLVVIISSILFLRQEKESAPDLNRLSSDLSGGISCTVQLQRGDFRAQSLFSQSFIGESSLRFFSPPSLDGFEIRQSEGKTSLAWKGMSCDLSSQQLLSQSGAGLFMQILGQLSDGLDEQQVQIEPEESSFRLTFPIQEGGSCSVVLEEQTLALLRIECPEQDASFILSDFQYTSQVPRQQEEKLPAEE